MVMLVYETFYENLVTEDMVKEAAGLFNENYGVWGKDSTGSQRVPKKGSRVKLSKDRLRNQCLPEGIDCTYARVSVDDHLAGHAFACRWKTVDDKTVCWITQLVVHADYRKRGLAFTLLNCLRQDGDNIYGIMSSHPAACLAAAKAFGRGITLTPTDFIRDNAESVMKHSPVDYIKNAVPRGKLFEVDDTSGAVSSVCTNFFVDHTEPLEALRVVREQGLEWPLGELLEGHEFLFVVESRPQNPSSSRLLR